MNSGKAMVGEHGSSSGELWTGYEIPLEDSLVVVRTGTDKLYVLNESAQHIWHQWRINGCAETITETLAPLYGIAREILIEDVSKTLYSWELAGLIGDRRFTAYDDLPPREPIELASGSMSPTAWFKELSYLFFDLVYRLRFASREIMASIDPLLSHLAIAEPASNRGVVIDIIDTENGFELLENNKKISTQPSLDAMVMDLFSHITQGVYDQRDSLLGMHAGAVAAHGRCIVLPGTSGSGKSTLSAALTDAGFTFLGDEVITIDRTTLKAEPLPLPMNLKVGSLAVLKSASVDLSTAKEVSHNQRSVHYLPPPHYQKNPPCRRYPVSCFIFPRYQKGADIKLSCLSAPTVLRRLIESNTVVTEPEDITQVKRVLRWLDKTPAYELCFDSLPDAVMEITRILESSER